MVSWGTSEHIFTAPPAAFDNEVKFVPHFLQTDFFFSSSFPPNTLFFLLHQYQ
jgi:hypothetical protein